jgi:hypothetical protein
MSNGKSLVAAVAAILIVAAAPARAVDGCKVLLCLAGPWESIPACVSEVEQLVRDLWAGAAFPSCSLAGGTPYAPNLANVPNVGAASASNVWLAQGTPVPDPRCPPQYVTFAGGLRRAGYGCRYAGMISVRVNGQPWSTTYWSLTDHSVTLLWAPEGALGAMPRAPSGAEVPSYDAAQAAGAAAGPPATPTGAAGG